MDTKKVKKSGSKQKIKGVIASFLNDYEQIVTDFDGSYTGTPADGDVPTQDADDL